MNAAAQFKTNSLNRQKLIRFYRNIENELICCPKQNDYTLSSCDLIATEV